MAPNRMRGPAAAAVASLILSIGTSPMGSAVAAESVTAGARLVVVFAGEVPEGFGRRVEALGGHVLSSVPAGGFATVMGLTAEAIRQISSDSGVIAVERDLIVGPGTTEEGISATDTGELAGDVSIQSHASPALAQFFPRQWNLKAIHAEDAWADGQLGSADVKVAVLDTGIDYKHPDLDGRVDLGASVSLLPLSQDCRSDEPGSASLMTEHNDALAVGDLPFRDYHSHGTAVAGLVVSNGHFLAGVTQNTTLIAIKVHDRRRQNCLSVYVQAIYEAVDRGADVIHLSFPLEFLLGGDENAFPGAVALVNRATSYAHDNGAIVVAAAGNAGEDLDHDRTRFRFCNAVHVICLSATGPTSSAGVNGPWQNPDAIAEYTNFGRSGIDVAGPGGSGTLGPTGPIARVPVWLICSQAAKPAAPPLPAGRACTVGGVIWSSVGTSFAAGATSGLAAMLVSVMGHDRPGDIAAVIRQSAVDLGPRGTDPYYGSGRIDVAAALTRALE